MHRTRVVSTTLSALLLGCIVWLIPQLQTGGAVRANAMDLLAQVTNSGFPYSGTSLVTYTQLPWYLLPPDVVPYAGRHRIQVRFQVRDRTHFRVDIETLRPLLEAGTVSIVVNGPEISEYDSRTNTAGRSIIPASVLKLESQYLLPFLESGMALNVNGSLGTVEAFLAQLRSPSLPACLARMARIIRQEQLLGRTADVIDFGPLQTSTYVTGCTFSHPGVCVHHVESKGWGRVWVSVDHPFVLKYVQHGFSNDAHALDVPNVGVKSHVTSLQQGVGPADLQLHAPVSVVNLGNESVLQSGSSGGNGPGAVPSGFLPAGTPDGFRNDGTNTMQSGPIPRQTVDMDLLFDKGHKVTTYIRSHVGGTMNPFGQYIVGPYVLVQERTRTGGLPAGLRIGEPQQAGRCQVWTGTFKGKQPWAAFARGKVSVLVSTNAMSASQLLGYVASEVCA